MKKSTLIITSLVIAGIIAATAIFFVNKSKKAKSGPPRIAINHSANKPEPINAENMELALQPPSSNASEKTLPLSNGTTSRTDIQADNQPASAPREEDRHVTLAFFDDLVELALKHYHPAHSIANPGNKGRLDLSVKTLNMHYGLSLEGLEGDSHENKSSARQTILSYVMTPAMLDILFDLYGKEFLLKAQEKAPSTVKLFPIHSQQPVSRPLSLLQQKEFFRLCGKKLQDLGRVFSTISTMNRFSSRVANFLKVRTELNNAYYTFWSLKDNNTEQNRIDEAANNIKKNILNVEKTKKALVASIVNKARPQTISQDDILYIAKWVFRRQSNDATSQKTFATLGKHLLTLGKDFSRQAETLQ